MEPAEAKLEQIGTAVREALLAKPSEVDDIRLARAGFLMQVAARNDAAQVRARRWPLLRWRPLLLTAATATAAIALWTWSRLPISFQVGLAGAPGHAGDLVAASEGQPTSVQFSEGSSLWLHAGGRLRVLSVDARGARVLVEEGTLDVGITPRKTGKGNWNFEAGPFHVRVTGTKFKLSYRASDQAFALATQEGQVMVSGPCLQGQVAVAAGSHLDLTCLAKQTPVVRTAELSPSPPAGHGPDPGTATATKPLREVALWREPLAAGRLQEGLRAAERAGFERVCQSATAKELLALADGARLFGRAARANLALRVLRQRFPASAEASIAAFTLGRIAFEQSHAYDEAAGWFRTYLREQPSGPLMGDAVGRLMEARMRAGDQVGARMDAEQYLRRFPEGPYASEARGILSK
jgi:transmembrane sensor